MLIAGNGPLETQRWEVIRRGTPPLWNQTTSVEIKSVEGYARPDGSILVVHPCYLSCAMMVSRIPK